MTNRVAVITGAGQEIGKAICLDLAEKGSTIAAVDKDLRKAEETAILIKGKGLKALSFEVETGKRESVEIMFDGLRERFGQIDILVNAGQFFRVTPLEEISENEWDLLMQLNLKGTFLCSQVCFRIMKKQHNGKIINISSYLSKAGGILSPGIYLPCAHYGAAKAAVENLTRSIAFEGAPYGILCNAVSPGLTFEDKIISAADPKNAISSKLPLGRLCTPQDIAAAVSFLASRKADYITAKILDVNGGLLMD